MPAFPPLSLSAATRLAVPEAQTPTLLPVPFIMPAAPSGVGIRSELSRCCSPLGGVPALSSGNASVACLDISLSVFPGQAEIVEPRVLTDSTMAVLTAGESADK